MPIKVTCSNCGGVLHAPDDAGGKRGRCPTCGNILPIPAVEAGGVPPDAPTAPPGARPPSFADFAMGPQVGPPPGGSADASRGSLGSFSPPAPPMSGDPPKRANKPPEPKETRRATEPHARGTAAALPPASSGAANTDGQAKAWKRCRGGFGLINIGLFLLFIPAVLLPAYYTADAVMKATSKPEGLLPEKPEGYLGLGVSSAVELPMLAAGVPVLLGLFFFLLGRLSVAGAPKRSGVGGPAVLAAVATLLALLAAVAIIMPNVALKLMGGKEIFPAGGMLFAWDSTAGMIQRLGLFFGIAAVVVGEFWFTSAIGRVGSALADRPTCARSTRLQMLLGLAVIFLVGTAAIAPAEAFGVASGRYEPMAPSVQPADALPTPPPRDGAGIPGEKVAPVVQPPAPPPEFIDYTARRNREIQLRGRTAPGNQNPAYELGRETNNLVAGLWETHVSPLLAKLGPWQGVLAPGLFLLGGLIVWFLYLRACGAARRAIGGWLDAHPVV